MIFLSKIFVIYDTKYGNTKLAAEKVLQGISTASDFETKIGYVKEINPAELVDYDVLVIGAPNHMGGPSRTMKKFVDQLSHVDLKAKNVAVFGTYSGTERSPDRAVKKLELIMKKKFPNVNLILPGLSVRVNGIPGPIVEGELPRCVGFGKRIANQLMKQ